MFSLLRAAYSRPTGLLGERGTVSPVGRTNPSRMRCSVGLTFSSVSTSKRFPLPLAMSPGRPAGADQL
jgi:hypothetical protein